MNAETKKEIDNINKQIEKLTQSIDNLSKSSSFPRDTETAIRERLQYTTIQSFITTLSSLTGILKASSGVLSAVTPLSGTKVYYVADTSGGAVTRKLTFSNGVLISES